MSKIVAVKDIGVPVPAPAPDATESIACYYGPKPLTPDYTQAARVALPISALSVTKIGGVDYYDFPVSTVLPATLPDGDLDFAFTLVDANGSEGDFSPVVSETVDRTPPQPWASRSFCPDATDDRRAGRYCNRLPAVVGYSQGP